jgi:predicted N-acetyltransferase YhbS
MIIRKATSEDIPAIVQLLKASLGDVSSTKSVAYWNWKHVDNPFGPSPVLVAEENGDLIGVRAFMRWDWVQDGKVYRALRAVDTATHPAHQGKGIFKKLTLQLVQDASNEGFDFIFNTPNTQSTPGYLKMGWEVWGRMPIWMRVCLFSFKFKPQVFESYAEQLQKVDLSLIPVLPKLHGMHTPASVGFLIWRYRECPVKRYAMHLTGTTGNRLWMFFTVKKNALGMELRICHSFFEGAESSTRLMKEACQLAREIGCRFVTLSGLMSVGQLYRLRFGFISIRSKSVQLTIRKLANSAFYEYLKIKTDWFFATGDIELF